MAGIHRRVADEVFDRLRERIVTGDLRPGDRVDSTEVAADLGVSLPSAGLLVSLYALGVAIGAPVLTALSGRWPRKQLLLALKAEVNELLASQGLPPRYHSAIREEDKVGS